MIVLENGSQYKMFVFWILMKKKVELLPNLVNKIIDSTKLPAGLEKRIKTDSLLKVTNIIVLDSKSFFKDYFFTLLNTTEYELQQIIEKLLCNYLLNIESTDPS